MQQYAHPALVRLSGQLCRRVIPKQHSSSNGCQIVETSKKSHSELVDRRLKDKPLQYIRDSRPFGGLDLIVRPPTRPSNCPRPSITPSPKRPISILDLCTGSGCIPLLLCHPWLQGSVRACGVDVSVDAVELAMENAARHSIPSVADARNSFRAQQGNVLDPAFPKSLEPPFNVLTSNPPYIPWKEYLELPLSVGGGPSGFEFYLAIAHIVSCQCFLKTDAVVALEVGHDQAEERTEIRNDPWGKARTVLG
ncbi:S-adenosyl-L-methionine-dependent methyltransferase [Desarmillaria ectypa]|nr:S-adenosyl-L-methionine-dependent methyltransferase [Desarmillaria ectypa]